jgi:hypothetical protein
MVYWRLSITAYLVSRPAVHLLQIHSLNINKIESQNKTGHCGMITIKGTIFPGFNKASYALTKQRDYLIHYVPELEKMRLSTINVRLENPISFVKFHAVTPVIEWDTQNHFADSFKFIRAAFALGEGSFKTPVPCLIYFASTSPYRENPFIVEVIAEELPIKGIEKCFLIFNEPSKSARWRIIGKTAWVAM